MPVDTVTRLLRPADLTEEVLAGLDPAAATLVSESATLEVEDARPLVPPAYRARHRVEDRQPCRDLWNDNPEWFPEEKTRDLASARQQVVVPLPERVQASAPIPEVAPRPTSGSGPLGVVMRAAQRLRGVLGGAE